MKSSEIKLRKILESSLGFSLLISIITLATGTLLFRPYFEDLDDLLISLVTEGAFGNHSGYTTRTNIILGKIMAMLSALIQGVRWHSILQCLFIFISMFTLTFILAHYRNGRVISLVIQISCFYELYDSLNYVKTSVFVSSVGLFAILHHVHRMYSKPNKMIEPFTVKGRKFAVALGYVLLGYGILLCGSGFLKAFVIALILGCVDVMHKVEDAGTKKILRYLSYIAPVFIAFLVLSAANKAVYDLSPGWEKYSYYNDLRTDAATTKRYILDYEKYGQELADLGVSANDAFLYSINQFEGENPSSPSQLLQIASLSRHRNIDSDFLKAWITDVYNIISEFSPAVVAFFAIFILFAVSSRMFSAGFVMCVLEGLWLIVLAFYHEYCGRFNRPVVFSSMLGTTVILWGYYVLLNEDFFADSKKRMKAFAKSNSLVISSLLGVCIIAAFGQRLKNEFDYQEYLRSGQDFTVIQAYMEENKDTLFVGDDSTISNIYKYQVFRGIAENALDNYVLTGGWLAGSTLYYDIVNRYGYEGHFDALKNGENVILLDNYYPERKAIYLSEHGAGPRYVAEYLENIRGFNLYRIK